MNIYIVQERDYRGIVLKTTAWSSKEKASEYVEAEIKEKYPYSERNEGFDISDEGDTILVSESWIFILCQYIILECIVDQSRLIEGEL